MAEAPIVGIRAREVGLVEPAQKYRGLQLGQLIGKRLDHRVIATSDDIGVRVAAFPVDQGDGPGGQNLL